MTFLGYIISGDNHPRSDFFKFVANKAISMGEIVEIRQSNSRKIFLGQVIQSYNISPQMKGEGFISYLLKKRPDRNLREIIDIEDSLNICDVSILGLYDINKKKYDITGEVPKAGMEVYSPHTNRLQEILFGNDGLYNIGKLFNTDSEIIISQKTIRHHIAIVGSTGSGKSHTGMVFCEEFNKQNLPVIVFDPHGEYYSLGYNSDGKKSDINIVEYTPNSLHVEGTKTLTFRPSEMTANELNIILGTSAGERQIQAAVGGLLNLKERKISKSITPKQELKEFIREIFRYSKDVKITSNSYDGAISRLQPFMKSGLFGEGIKLKDVVKEGQITIFDVSGLSKLNENTMVGVLLRKLFNARINKEIPPFILIIEEVHRYTEDGQSSTKAIVSSIVKEGRKFDIGTLLLSQRPSDIDNSIFTQCNTLISMRLLDNSDISRIKSRLGHLDALNKQLPFFPIGRGILTGFGTRFPVQIQIRERYTGFKNNNVIKRSINKKKPVTLSQRDIMNIRNNPDEDPYQQKLS